MPAFAGRTLLGTNHVIDGYIAISLLEPEPFFHVYVSCLQGGIIEVSNDQQRFI
jgi:hypothetical protein